MPPSVGVLQPMLLRFECRGKSSPTERIYMSASKQACCSVGRPVLRSAVPANADRGRNFPATSSPSFLTHYLASADDMHYRRSVTDRPTSQQACQHDCRFFLRKTPEPEMFTGNKLRNVISDRQCKHTALGHLRKYRTMKHLSMVELP